MQAYTKGNIWILGYFTLPKLDRSDNIPSFKPKCTCRPICDICLDILADFNLVQMTTHPTRHGNILDLFLITNPTLINNVACQLGLGDHDMAIAECSVKPIANETKPRKVHLFGKSNWPKFKKVNERFPVPIHFKPRRKISRRAFGQLHISYR